MDETEASTGFGELLTHWSWWDVPRSGVALIDDETWRFACDFDDELDDYPDAYALWRVTARDLAAELEAWEVWVSWRRSFDLGTRPEAFERHPRYAVVKGALGAYERRPASHRFGIPEWRLDPERSFAHGVPRHLVRWRLRPQSPLR